MTDRTVPSDITAFSLDLLATARTNAAALDVCKQGHLVVAGRAHYRPLRFTEDLKSLVCGLETHE